MKRLLIVLAIFLLIIETSLYAAHPIGLVPPIEYFSEEERPMFLLLVLLTFGTGYPLLGLITGQKEWNKRSIVLLFVCGLAVKIFINSGTLLFAFALALLISAAIKKYRTVIGWSLLGIGLFAIMVPLLILYYDSETYMDVEAYQSVIALFQSKDYVAYVLYNLQHFIGPDLLAAVFILLPSILISPAVTKWLSKYHSWKFVAATGLILLGILIKTLIMGTSSAIAFHLLTSAGGFLAALGLFMVLRQALSHVTSLGWAIFLAECCILLTYTSLAIGHYRTLHIDDILIQNIIIWLISAVIFFIVEKFTPRNDVKA